jgi:uncharacterized membrane protein
MKPEFDATPDAPDASGPSIAAQAAQTRTALAGLLAGGAVLAIYLIACHEATTSQSAWGPWLYAAPLYTMLFSGVATRWGNLAGGAACGSAAAAMAWGLSRWGGDQSIFYVVQHVGTNLALCWLFGHTLLNGREPLITRFARIVRRGDMPPAVLAYTRGATLAWALFFVAIATVSLLLYAGAPVAVWSTFSNLVCGPLVGVMFVCEYVARRILLRGATHHPFMAAVHAFRQPWPANRSDSSPGDAR